MVSSAVVYPQIDRAVATGTSDTEIFRNDSQLGYQVLTAHIKNSELVFAKATNGWVGKQIFTLPAGTKVIRTARLKISAWDFTHPLNATPIEAADVGDIALGTIATLNDDTTSPDGNDDIITRTAIAALSNLFDVTVALAAPLVTTVTGIFVNMNIDATHITAGDVLRFSGSLIIGYDYLGS